MGHQGQRRRRLRFASNAVEKGGLIEESFGGVIRRDSLSKCPA
jgi:hypothetical protein